MGNRQGGESGDRSQPDFSVRVGNEQDVGVRGGEPFVDRFGAGKVDAVDDRRRRITRFDLLGQKLDQLGGGILQLGQQHQGEPWVRHASIED